MQKSTLLLLIVLLIPVLYFVYGLIGWNVAVSFTDYEMGTPGLMGNFTGLANYSELFRDSLFWKSLVNTLVLFLIVPCSVLLGLLISHLLSNKIKGEKIFTIIYLLPFAFSFSVTAVVWNWLYALNGPINTVFRSIGLGFLANPWHTSPHTVLPALLIVGIWQLTGYCVILFLPKMKSLRKLNESKDKSTGGKPKGGIFSNLKVPILSAVVVMMIFALKLSFDLVWVLTSEGGPGTSAYTLPIYLFKQYQAGSYASAAAIGNIMIGLVFLIIIPYIWWSTKEEAPREEKRPKKRPSWGIKGALLWVPKKIASLLSRAFGWLMNLLRPIGRAIGSAAKFPRQGKRAIVYLVLILFAIASLFPIYVMVCTSLKPEEEIMSSSPLAFPASPTLDAYGEAWGEISGTAKNSLIFVLGAVALSVVIGAPLGYVLAKVKFKHRRLIFFLFSVGMFLPYTTIVIPLVQTMRAMGLIYTIPGMILVHTIYGIPICAFIFRNFYSDIPDRSIEKERKKGAGDWSIYRKLIIPISIIAVITLVTYQFTSVWNDYLFGLVLGGTVTEARPITRSVAELQSWVGIKTNAAMAGSIIAVIPVILIYIFLHGYLVKAMVKE
jgi:glucose/mannose transport system permease protein